MKKKILLTGCTGFVGSQVLKVLNKRDFEVTVAIRKLMSVKVINSENTKYITEISKDTDWSDLICDQEVVIHCAARVHIMKDVSSNPIAEFKKVNTEGTINLARQAVEAGVKRFIFLSSIKVNGETTSDRAPFTNLDDCLPVDPYGISKLEAEKKLLELGKETGLEIVIIRPPLVYGEGVKANFASLMRLVGKSCPLPFRSMHHNKRSLVSVYNLVDLIKVCVDHSQAANQVFLISDDNDLSTLEIVFLMARVQGKANLAFPVPAWCFKLVGKIFNKDLVVERLIGSLQLDIENTKDTLDWVPPYSVEHGFRLAAKSK